MSGQPFYPRLTPCDVIYPKAWWQRPFALALMSGQKLYPKCRLCNLNIHQTLTPEQMPKDCNPHWFNCGRFLCQACHDSIAWQHSRFTLNFSSNLLNLYSLEGVASTFYQYPFDTVVRDFKNQHQLHQLPLLIHAIRQLELPHGCHANNSLILPIPTTRKRLANRGFDPVTLLVQYLSFHWQVPIFPHIVREERQKQQGLDKNQRLENTQNAFAITQSPFETSGNHATPIKHLIVFDDVATTGATLQSLCQTLIEQFSHANFNLHVRAVVHGNG